MKIFWSWQYDTPGNTGRHFVRDALDTAIEQLKKDISVEEPMRDLEPDQDYMGAPGSAYLTRLLLEKIENTGIFIADVTPVGKTIVPGAKMRPLINSNVAIELGYARARLGEQRLLTILNNAYGAHDDLPFNIRHMAGTIFYHLSPGATPKERIHEKDKLTGMLKAAIRECLSNQYETNENMHSERETTVS